MSIILCGMPTAGKTTIGKIVASELCLDFIDTDALIENAHPLKYSCRDIFLKEGSFEFRALEKEQIKKLHKKSSVIATGAGSLQDEENVKILQKIGDLIYLKTEMAILWERIKKRGLPAYLDPKNPERSFYEMMEIRKSHYEQIANIIIDTRGLNEREVVTLVLKIKEKNGQ